MSILPYRNPLLKRPSPSLVPANDELIIDIEGVIRAQQLVPHFMEIRDIRSGAVIGHESLIRSAVARLTPAVLFGAAADQGQLAPLDLACLAAGLEEGHALPGKIFVNIRPETLTQSSRLLATILRSARKKGVDLQRVVLEITEYAPLVGGSDLSRTVRRLARLGIRFALDDIGDGHCHLAHVADIQPAYIKLSSRRGGRVPAADAMVEIADALELASRIGAELILEGMEREEQLEAARRAGVRYAQGYIFGRPWRILSLPVNPLAVSARLSAR